MVKNVRWLYNKLGTVDISSIGNGTVSSALSTVQSGLDSKAASSHTHEVSDLPVSNSQVDSTSYVPSSAVVYSLKSTMDSMNTEIRNIDKSISDKANSRYESKNLGTWTTASDVDAFLSRFTHENGYKDGDTELSIGNYVTIYQDNRMTYYQYIIAGFDCEHNQTAADGTVYDNGYGIALIPKKNIYSCKWCESSSNISGGYMNSFINTSVIPSLMADNHQDVIGAHLVNRNVLLSSGTDSNYYSNAYTWTTAKATLMSVGQMTGTFASTRNKYDDGEANYKLPLFNYESYTNGANFWLRNIYGTGMTYIYVGTSTGYDWGSCTGNGNVRPLIYLR